MTLSALLVQLLNGLAGASSLFLVSAGLSLIFGVTRIVNFAHGSLMMLGAYAAYSLVGRIGGSAVGYWSAVLLAALAVGVIGAGALALPREPANLNMDLAVIADVFVVTVVGGLGSIRGAFVAALIIGVVKALCIGIGDVTAWGATFSFPKLTLVAEFVVMAVVLVIRPWGLFGRAPSAPVAPEQRELQAAPARRFAVLVAIAFAALAAAPLAVDD